MITFILIWLAIGLIAGFLASHVMGGGHGIVFDILIGLVGSVIGGLILGVVSGYQADGFISHAVVAFLGAVVLLVAVRLVEGPTRHRLWR